MGSITLFLTAAVLCALSAVSAGASGAGIPEAVIAKSTPPGGVRRESGGFMGAGGPQLRNRVLAGGGFSRPKEGRT